MTRARRTGATAGLLLALLVLPTVTADATPVVERLGRHCAAAAGDRSMTRPGARARRPACCCSCFALLTVLVAVRHGAPLPGDLALHRWPLDHRPPVAVATARAVTATGTGALPYVLAVVAGLIAGRGTKRRWYAAAGALAVLALGQAVRYGLMAAVARPAPGRPRLGDHGVRSLLPLGAHHHERAHGRTARLGGADPLRPSAARTTVALLLLWAAAVGLSRIYLGVHWASDVLGGWLFASLWLCLAALATAPSDRARATEPNRRSPRPTRMNPWNPGTKRTSGPRVGAHRPTSAHRRPAHSRG